MVCAMHSSRHQLRSAQVDETYPCTYNSRLGTGYQSGEVPQGYEYLKFYLGGEISSVTQEVTLEAFSDANYAADDDTRNSLSDTAILLNGMPMS